MNPKCDHWKVGINIVGLADSQCIEIRSKILLYVVQYLSIGEN